jgi:toxin-antitoxin system PIN domain toxin
MTYLPDVNVWIALAAEQHTHHRFARQWFANLRDAKLAFCRVTQLGFLRLLTNTHVMQDEVMSPDEAWQAYGVLRSDRRIGYMAEPNDLPEAWGAFTEGRLSSPSLWTDAYLCAFVHAARLTLVTFDANIPTREGVSCLVLAGSP